MLPAEKPLVSVEQELFVSATRDDCTISAQQPTQLCLQIADDLILLAFSTCFVRICSTRQKTKKNQRVTPVGINSPEPPTAFSHATGSFAVQRRAQQMVAVTHQRRVEHPEASFLLKRTSCPPETPCSRAAIELLSRNPNYTTCCPRSPEVSMNS